jgi:hypothetical protein
MVKMEADFDGWATKAGLKCSDGRTIMPDAFKHQDTMKVPLVWQHGHSDPENVLGHAILENRDEGVYAYGFFNDSPKAVHTHGLIQHKDITMMSIWANDLIERSKKVLHGAIREVSLVLSGANPGALIENVTIRHSDDDMSVLEDEAIIYTGLSFEHANGGGTPPPAPSGDTGKTVQDVYDSMNPEQQQVLHYMVGMALEQGGGDNVAQSAIPEELQEAYESLDEKQKKVLHHMIGEALQHDGELPDTEKGDKMKHNIFEGDDKDKKGGETLSHEDMKGIVADATKCGSLKQATEAYALAHGINQIDTLFPEAQALTSAPEFYTRRTEWVNTVLGGARKSPFARVKTHFADLTYDDARAKGYITGDVKKEQFFSTSRRETMPQTIYKMQKLDRDDIIDITDFDVVAWMKSEMRLMLDEEIARAILIGDGRDVASSEKILEDRIRPIATDDPLFTIEVLADFAANGVQDVVDAIVQYRALYRGTGTPAMYTSEQFIAQVMLLKDTLGRRIYTSLDQFASEIRVSSIIPVDVFDPGANPPLAVIVNMTDYVLGSDKGGEVNLFDDFDIDYNQYKYLIEGRCSGALVKMKSAMVVKQGTFVAPPAGTVHIIVPEPPNARQSVPPVHGSLPDASGGTTEGASSKKETSREKTE